MVDWIKAISDAEHPSTITMHVTPSPQGRRGPWTRAHACTVETEVDSFLFKLHSVSYESRFIPQIETLCLVRYQGDDREDTRTEIQATMEKEERSEKREEGGALDTPGARALWPRRPAPLALLPASPGCPTHGPGCPASHGPAAA